MKESCKHQRFVCQECIYKDHSDHQNMISTFDNLELQISNRFGDTFLDIHDVFDQIYQQQEFQVIKQQIYDEFDKLETQFNQNQKQIKELLDAYKIISKIKDGYIMEISVDDFNILSEIFYNQKINNQSALNSNLTLLRNKSMQFTTKLKEIQQYIISTNTNLENLDFGKFINRNIKQKIISQFYTQNLLDYSLVPSEYQYIRGVKVAELENNNEIYYGQINEKQFKHGKGMQIIKNGDIIYEGIWEQDYFLWGQKTTFNENTECCIFQGKMINKKLNGLGLKKSSFEYEIKGNFIDDKVSGNVILTTDKGDLYKGEFYENKKHGKGVLQTIKGDKYDGSFYNDKKQGTGTYYFSNGDIYKGSFQDDQIHGRGQLICYNTGDVYIGIFKNNKKEGEFDVKHSNGQIDQVVFKNDQSNGKVKAIIKKSAQAIKGTIFHDKKQ
ncbi:unnamed protein product [Paramecium primaurelia]|uniref:MORN repeat protein n=1 Tax=Paramecium primaurelia TaxID=5886 RepID=A0A8S1NAR1_PARPR|nr:unnamed protein product [Paramecium primaurelia]